MAVSDKSIDPKLLKSARKEFLEAGFEKASLKNICTNAGVTTGALYKRFKGKDELFGAVVKETVEDFHARIDNISAPDVTTLSDDELYAGWDMGSTAMEAWFSYFFSRKEDFKLLTACSTGSSYAGFLKKTLDNCNQLSFAHYHEMKRRGICTSDFSDRELAILLKAYWQPIIECLSLDITWEEAMHVCQGMCCMISFEKVLGFKLTPQSRKIDRAGYFQ